MNHFTSDDAARWAAGLLDEADATQLEAHARGCAGCEALLAQESRVEAALAAALTTIPAPGPVGARRSPRLALVLVPLALAASLAVFLGARATTEQGPAEQIVVPRYEHDHQVPLESLAALEPAGL